MIENTIRTLKRLLIFLPGLGVILLVLEDVYPVFNKRLPALLALLLTYLFSAYVLIPFVFRLLRIISAPKHVPFYSTTPDGFASDPINIALFGSRDMIIKAMTMIGWFVAEPKTPRNVLRLIISVILRRPYVNAPFSTLYLMGRSQDIGFQLPVDRNPRHRHHVRFWAVKPTTAEKFQEHVAFWQGHHPDKDWKDDTYLWLGAASLDTGFGLIRHNAQVTHMIHHDTNAERKLIVRSLQQVGLAKKTRTIKIASPYQLRNRVLTGYLQSDGKLTIIEL